MTGVSIGGAPSLAPGADFDLSADDGLAVTWEGPLSARPILAAAAYATREGHIEPDPSHPERVTFDTPHGAFDVVVHGAPGKPDLVVVEALGPSTPRDRLMVQMVAMAVGLSPHRVMAAKAQPQVVDAGRPTLVVPVDEPEALRGLQDGDTERVAPEAEAVAAYVVTQRRPYARADVRIAPQDAAVEPFVAAAVPVHALNTQLLRANYPLTRFVCDVGGDTPAHIECRCHLESTGGGPKFTSLRVGGKVSFS